MFGCLRNCLQILCGWLGSPLGLFPLLLVLFGGCLFFFFADHPVEASAVDFVYSPPLFTSFFSLWMARCDGPKMRIRIPAFGACVISFKSSISHRLFCLCALFSRRLPMCFTYSLWLGCGGEEGTNVVIHVALLIHAPRPPQMSHQSPAAQWSPPANRQTYQQPRS